MHSSQGCQALQRHEGCDTKKQKAARKTPDLADACKARLVGTSTGALGKNHVRMSHTDCKTVCGESFIMLALRRRRKPF
jgi:hypothetical protein